MLTQRDEELLDTLCRKVRMVTLQQITETWWDDSGDASKRLKRLCEEDWLVFCKALAVPLPPLDEPVLEWAPGQSAPDFGETAWKLKSRWKEPPQLTTIYIASKRAGGVFGGRPRGKLKQAFQATHDLGVSQVYLQCFRSDLPKASKWIGEDQLAPLRQRQKVPDAVIAQNADAAPELVVEFGGAYDKGRVAEFHKWCASETLPYEIW